ncbi:MAG: YveK family protein, partial [Acidimicrobiales bacterium]
MPHDPRDRDSDLREYGRTLWRRKGLIALAVAVTVGASLVYSFVTKPVYAATASVLLGPRVVESPFDPSAGVRLDANRTVANEIEVFKSKSVTDAVTDKIGPAPRVSVTSRTGTDVLYVTADSTDRVRAAEVANAYANAYIEFRRTRAVDDLLAAGKQIQSKVSDLQREIDTASGGAREQLLQQQLLFKQKLDQLQVDAALKTGGAELVTPAAVPSTPVKPKPLQSALIALVVGLLVGVALAFLVEFLDDSVKSKEDLDRVAPDLRVIGLNPLISGWKPAQYKVVSVEDTNSGASVAYSTLRT